MPQVLAKPPQRLPRVVLLSILVALLGSSPLRAVEPAKLGFGVARAALRVAAIVSWPGSPIAIWLADAGTGDPDPDGETAVDHGGASMDPAGQPGSQNPGAGGAGGG